MSNILQNLTNFLMGKSDEAPVLVKSVNPATPIMELPDGRYTQLRKWGFSANEIAAMGWLVQKGQLPEGLFQNGKRKELRSLKYRKLIRKTAAITSVRYREIGQKLKELQKQKYGSQRTESSVG